jgi:pyrroline-5-carboxylate reductase
MIAEQTPGGVNEGAIRALDEKGVFGSFKEQLDAILLRLKGTK